MVVYLYRAMSFCVQATRRCARRLSPVPLSLQGGGGSDRKEQNPPLYPSRLSPDRGCGRYRSRGLVPFDLARCFIDSTPLAYPHTCLSSAPGWLALHQVCQQGAQSIKLRPRWGSQEVRSRTMAAVRSVWQEMRLSAFLLRESAVIHQLDAIPLERLAHFGATSASSSCSRLSLRRVRAWRKASPHRPGWHINSCCRPERRPADPPVRRCGNGR